MGQYLSDKNNYVPSSKDSHKFEIPWYLITLFLKYVKFGNFGTYEKHYSLFPLFSNVREGRGSTLINWLVCDEQTQSLIFQLFFFFVYHLQMQCFLVVLAVYTKKKILCFGTTISQHYHLTKPMYEKHGNESCHCKIHMRK